MPQRVLPYHDYKSGWQARELALAEREAQAAKMQLPQVFSYCMRPYANSVGGLELLVYEALSY